MTEDILNNQKAFFRSGKTLSVSYRKSVLESLKRTVMEMEGEINDALLSDLGKSGTEAYMCETGMTLSSLSHTISHLRSYSRRRRARTPLAQFPARSYIIPEPYGNVLVMSPWNYPLLLSLSPVVSAVAAGNTVILKPSAYSPATSSVIRRIIGKVFPQEHVAVIEGGREVNSDLLEQKFDYIFFTGSKTVGRTVMAKAAEHLTPVTLELGGKSPVIIDRSLIRSGRGASGADDVRSAGTDLRTAARRIVFGKFLNCGQTCVAPDYAIVHEDIAEEFIALCREETSRMFGPAPLENPDYGKIVNRKHFDRLVSCLEEIAPPSGTAPVLGPGHAEILYGGGSDAAKLKIEPTIVMAGSIDSAQSDHLSLMQDEIFGPVMPVLTYRDIESVINYIDERPRPLAAYIFTSDRCLERTLLERLHFGGGCVNDTIIHLATEQMPFGGVGESGMGRYHGKYGFDTFTHLKSIVDKPLWLDLPMRYQPYGKLKEMIIRMFLK